MFGHVRTNVKTKAKFRSSVSSNKTNTSKSQTPKLHHHQSFQQSISNISSSQQINRMISEASSIKISQCIKVNMQTQKSSIMNPPSKSQASFRSRSTDLNVSDVLNLMKAVISKHSLLFLQNLEIFICQPPKTEILLRKIVSGTERMCAQCHRKYETKSY